MKYSIWIIQNDDGSQLDLRWHSLTYDINIAYKKLEEEVDYATLWPHSQMRKFEVREVVE